MAERVQTVLRVGDSTVHRFQVVREHRADGSMEEWIVVDFGEDDVRLADLGLEWSRDVALEAFRSGRFEPVEAGGVPVWGY